MHGVQVYVNGPENAGGVISEPEISSHRLSKGDKVLIFGSDGVWDHVSSAEAVAIAANAKTPQAASDRIAQIARERWRRSRGRRRGRAAAAAAPRRPNFPYHF